VADPLSRCPKLLLHVARTQATTCAHEVIPIPEQDRAFHGPVGLASQSHPRGPANNQPSKYMVAFLAAIATAPVPDGIDDLLTDIAAWNHTHRTEAEQSMENTSYTYHKGLWRYTKGRNESCHWALTILS
jgi:hypothetical protein